MRPSITVSTELAPRSDVIEAALAINEAPTLAEAFRVLAEAARDLVGADSVTVVAGDDDSGDEVVQAATGDPADAGNALRIPLSTRYAATASSTAGWSSASTQVTTESRFGLTTDSPSRGMTAAHFYG